MTFITEKCCKGILRTFNETHESEKWRCVPEMLLNHTHTVQK